MVELYEGGYSIVSRSGIGQALVHQEKVLNGMNVQTSRRYQKRERIVHINTVLPDSVVEAFRAKRRGQRVIWFAHSTEEDFKNSFPGSNLIAPLFKAWIMFCYQRGDVIITPTEYSRHLLRNYGIRKPIYVLTNGVDTDYFVPDKSGRASFRQSLHLSSDAQIVMSVGHLIERKGILDFIEAAEQMPEVTFLWYGDTAKQLVTQTVRSAMESAPANVKFMGFAPQEELKKAYQSADAFLFLSHEETEGIVVLEALSCELPVILRDIPVYENWLTDGKNVCKVHNMADTLAHLRKILYSSGVSKDGSNGKTQNGPGKPEDEKYSGSFNAETGSAYGETFAGVIARGGRQVADARGYRLSGKQLLQIYELEGMRVS